jgi:hypothetical protein
VRAVLFLLSVIGSQSASDYEGVRIKLGAATTAVVTVGTNFRIDVLKLDQGSEELVRTQNWVCLTPELARVVDSDLAVVEAKHVGTAVFRYRQFFIAPGPRGKDIVDFKDRTVVIRIDPVKEIHLGSMPDLLQVGESESIGLQGFKKPAKTASTSKKAYDERSKQFADLLTKLKGSESPEDALPTLADFFVGAPITVRVVRGPLEVSLSNVQFADHIEVANGRSFYLRSNAEGEAVLRFESDGYLIEERKVDCVDPKPSLTLPDVIIENQAFQLPIKLTSGTIDDLRLRKAFQIVSVVATKGNSRAVFQASSSDREQYLGMPPALGKCDLVVEYRRSGGNSKIHSAKYQFDAESTVDRATAADAAFDIVQGDTVRLPLKLFKSKDPLEGISKKRLKVTVKEDCGLTATVVNGTGGGYEVLISATPDFKGTVPLELSVDNRELLKFNLKALPQLQITMSETTDREMRDKFGVQLTKEFFIRELKLTNNLGRAASTDLKGKEIIVFSNSITPKVMVRRSGRPKVAEAVVKATSNDGLTQFLLGIGDTDYTMPFNPVLYEALASSADSRNQRRSEDVLDNVLSEVKLIVELIGGLHVQKEAGRFPFFGRNPFQGERYLTNRTAFDTFFTGLVGLLKGNRDKRGKSFNADNVLGQSLHVPATGEPTSRFLFVPRDRIQGAIRGVNFQINGVVRGEVDASYIVVREQAQKTKSGGS